LVWREGIKRLNAISHVFWERNMCGNVFVAVDCC
jgi:hypothetical protein